MKELSIEEKAKAYDEAIERANELYDEHERDIALLIFPELKESEDERIRKELIKIVNDHYSLFKEIDRAKTIAWLEKQGEQKSVFEMKTPEESLGIDSDTYNKIVDDCIYGEQKPADKVEPKFKVGDWITDGNITIQIEAIKNDCYLYCGDCALYSTKTADKVYHLWTIQDAKDGDALIDEDNNIGIYKEIEGICWHSYIYLGCDNRLYGFSIGGSHMQNNTKPTTKKQRDQLEKAMFNAGYTFDFEKKELRKIEQNSAWSEEDEKYYNSVLWHIKNSISNGKPDTITKCDVLNCFKSLRPQSTWKPSNEQMLSLERASNSLVSTEDTVILRKLLNGLKTL